MKAKFKEPLNGHVFDPFSALLLLDSADVISLGQKWAAREKKKPKNVCMHSDDEYG